MNHWKKANQLEKMGALMRVLDYTSLQPRQPFFSISDFCGQAVTGLGCAASVCILPTFVADAKRYLKGTGVAVATVINFPKPSLTAQEASAAIGQAVAAGADEIDVVMPYEKIQAGDVHETLTWLVACRRACGQGVLMKVILETGALQDSKLIATAAQAAMEAEADFLKTSTGVDFPGAEPKVVKQLAKLIYDSGLPVGLKISGGIKTLSQAMQLTDIVVSLWGDHAVDARRYRIGASALRKVLVGSSLIAG